MMVSCAAGCSFYLRAAALCLMLATTQTITQQHAPASPLLALQLHSCQCTFVTVHPRTTCSSSVNPTSSSVVNSSSRRICVDDSSRWEALQLQPARCTPAGRRWRSSSDRRSGDSSGALGPLVGVQGGWPDRNKPCQFALATASNQPLILSWFHIRNHHRAPQPLLPLRARPLSSWSP